MTCKLSLFILIYVYYTILWSKYEAIAELLTRLVVVFPVVPLEALDYDHTFDAFAGVAFVGKADLVRLGPTLNLVAELIDPEILLLFIFDVAAYQRV